MEFAAHSASWPLITPISTGQSFSPYLIRLSRDQWLV